MRSLAILFFVNVYFSFVLPDTTYECGEHGRFEYCIDEIPGCVIGCHCHPGYYFDTDTKICEPNSKLIEHRRHYVEEPTRFLRMPVTQSSRTDMDSVATNKLDTHVEEISKDPNDLGDWLYNQFFKTIESQVINETSNNGVPSRRSGSQPIVSKPKRKRKWNKDKKRKQKKSRNLKKKLLRITENDSLFDMKESDSDSSDSSSSDSSFEYDRHSSDEEHGHKKIVMFNKKPKPQLPSFIFLPNLDTPFYPPIGLPPPPVVPMYPIVPVPPVIPTGVDCTTNAATTKLSTTQTTTLLTTISTTVSKEPDTTVSNVEPTTSNPNIQQLMNKRKKKISRIHTPIDDVNDNNNGLSNLQPSERQKLLLRLREKMNRPAGKMMIAPWKKKKKTIDTFANGRNFNPIDDSPMYDESMITNHMPAKQAIEPSENVDFKYLTELIHKVDMNNKTYDLPPIEYNPDNLEVFQSPGIEGRAFPGNIAPPNIPDARRYTRPNHRQSTDDLYYTRLGREIASMIRGIESQNKNINMQLEATGNAPKSDVYFNENSPRSYWERSVRSPTTLLEANNNKFEYLKKSNEILFNIENKIEIIASTVPTLSLQEIENIVSIIETTNKEIKNKETRVENDNSLNVKLWPQRENVFVNNNKMPATNRLNYDLKKEMKIAEKKIHMPKGTNGVQVHNFRRFIAWRQTPKDMSPNKQIIKTDDKIKPNVKSYSPMQANSNKNPPLENTQKIMTTLSNKSSKQRLLGYDMNSLNFKHRKYFNDDSNDYMSKPFLYSRVTPPSYFRQEINHFDYFN